MAILDPISWSFISVFHLLISRRAQRQGAEQKYQAEQRERERTQPTPPPSYSASKTTTRAARKDLSFPERAAGAMAGLGAVILCSFAPAVVIAVPVAMVAVPVIIAPIAIPIGIAAGLVAGGGSLAAGMELMDVAERLGF